MKKEWTAIRLWKSTHTKVKKAAEKSKRTMAAEIDVRFSNPDDKPEISTI